MLVLQEWENNDAVSMLTYTILLLTFIFNIFILCFIGELLTDQVLTNNCYLIRMVKIIDLYYVIAL